MDNDTMPCIRQAAAGRPRPVRRLVMAVTGLATVVELFDTAVVELFEDEPDHAAA